MNSLFAVCIVASAVISTEPNGSTFAQCQQAPQPKVKLVNFLQVQAEKRRQVNLKRIRNQKIKDNG